MRILLLCIVLALSGCAGPKLSGNIWEAMAIRFRAADKMLEQLSPDGCYYDNRAMIYKCENQENLNINKRVKQARYYILDSIRRGEDGPEKHILLNLYHCRDADGNKLVDDSRVMYCETKLPSDLVDELNDYPDKKLHASKVNGRYRYWLSL